VKTDVPQGFYEARRHLIQFTGVIICKPAEDLPPFAGNAEDRTASVMGVGDALEEPLPFRAVHQLDRTVVPEAKACGRIGDCDDGFIGSASHLKKQLMLLGM